jgi:O-antigen/teichoic acid export membrane protein
VNDAIYAVVQMGALVVLAGMGSITLVGGIFAWGLGACAGAAVGHIQFGVRWWPTVGIGHIRDHRSTGAWIAADFLTYFSATQVYLLLVAVLAGTTALGALRAAHNLLGPAQMIILAAGSFGLTQAPRALAEGNAIALHETLTHIRRLLVLGVGCIALVVLAMGPQLMAWLYGPRFAVYGDLSRIVALQFLLMALTVAPSLGLKTLRVTSALFRARLFATAGTLTAVLMLIPPFGLAGAAWAGVAGAAITATVTAVAYQRRVRGRHPHGKSETHLGRPPAVVGDVR